MGEIRLSPKRQKGQNVEPTRQYHEKRVVSGEVFGGGGVTPEEDDSQKRPLRLQFETMLRLDIKVRGGIYEVEGYPDYSVWYEDIGGNADKTGSY